MNRRGLFSFLAAAPAGITSGSGQDSPVTVTPGQQCKHCGCLHHYTKELGEGVVIDSAGAVKRTLCWYKEVCDWCGKDWDQS